MLSRARFVPLLSMLALAGCPEGAAPDVPDGREPLVIDAGAEPEVTATVLTNLRGTTLALHDAAGRPLTELLADADGATTVMLPDDGSVTEVRPFGTGFVWTTVVGVRDGDRVDFTGPGREAVSPLAGLVDVNVTGAPAGGRIFTTSACGGGASQADATSHRHPHRVSTSPCPGPVLAVHDLARVYSVSPGELVVGGSVTVGGPWMPVPRATTTLVGVPPLARRLVSTRRARHGGHSVGLDRAEAAVPAVDGRATVDVDYVPGFDVVITQWVFAGRRWARWSRPAEAFATPGLEYDVAFLPPITAVNEAGVIRWTIPTGTAATVVTVNAGRRWTLLADPGRGQLTLPTGLAAEVGPETILLDHAKDRDWTWARTHPELAIDMASYFTHDVDMRRSATRVVVTP